MEVGVVGAAAVKNAVEERAREQGNVLRNRHIMEQHVQHIQTLIRVAVIQWVVAAVQQQAVDHTEVVVRNVEAELRREHVLRNRHIMEQHVQHILTQQVVIQ